MKTSTLFPALGLALALAANGAAAQQAKITVGYTSVSEFMPMFVAKEHGFFAKRGLDVTPQALALSSVMPAALTGMRLSLTVALVLSIVGEMLASQPGLGAAILSAARLFRAPELFAGVALLGAIGLASNALLELAGRAARVRR